jgi:hypothetical protein
MVELPPGHPFPQDALVVPDDRLLAELELERRGIHPISGAAGTNGSLTSDSLAPIAGGTQLGDEAAAAWNSMAAHIYEARGTKIVITGPNSAYRSVETQWYFWRLYQAGGNLAAHPGTSNHGWGLAVDVPIWVRQLIDEYGRPFGWAKEWSDAPSEWWHLRYNASAWSGSDPGPAYAGGGHHGPRYPTLTKGDKGGAVKRAQRHLERWNDGLTKPKVDGAFGDQTLQAVKEFQKSHPLKPDGVIGKRTWHALRKPDLLLSDERTHVNRIRGLLYGGVIDANARKLREWRKWCRKRAISIRDEAEKHGWNDQHRFERWRQLDIAAGPVTPEDV